MYIIKFTFKDFHSVLNFTFTDLRKLNIRESKVKVPLITFKKMKKNVLNKRGKTEKRTKRRQYVLIQKMKLNFENIY